MSWAEKRAAQDARREQLARLRLSRGLTPEERTEEARLEQSLAMRVWRESLAEESARLSEQSVAA